jgi:hypothetical protein
MLYMSFGFLALKDFKIMCISNMLVLAYLMKVITEMRRTFLFFNTRNVFYCDNNVKKYCLEESSWWYCMVVSLNSSHGEVYSKQLCKLCSNSVEVFILLFDWDTYIYS